jgi:mitochondrial fission protein ELM1
MATEAAATAKPVHLLAVDGSSGKHEPFLRSLARRGCTRPFIGRLETWSYAPLLETDRVAAAVLTAWAARTKTP